MLALQRFSGVKNKQTFHGEKPELSLQNRMLVRERNAVALDMEPLVYLETCFATSKFAFFQISKGQFPFVFPRLLGTLFRHR